jgi:hypothetical protein
MSWCLSLPSLSKIVRTSAAFCSHLHSFNQCQARALSQAYFIHTSLTVASVQLILI